MTDESVVNRSKPVLSIPDKSSAGEGRSVLVKKPIMFRVIPGPNITPLPSSSDSETVDPVINVLQKGEEHNLLSEFTIHLCAFFMKTFI